MSRLTLLLFALPLAAQQQSPKCEAARPPASFTIKHRPSAGDLNTDPNSPLWRRAQSATIVKDCSRQISYPNVKSEVKAFWTPTDVYFLFICRYETLNIFLPADNSQPRRKLWDRDVVEVFLGDDWNNIRHYREYEVAPTGDWIDLAIDLDKKGGDRGWRSGWTTSARIDEKAHIWYAAMRIPLKSVTEAKVAPGTRWRMNLYRIEGQGEDPVRHFLCWQPTCVLNRDPNHVPENFGTLIFAK
jgi:hypothetical protein